MSQLIPQLTIHSLVDNQSQLSNEKHAFGWLWQTKQFPTIELTVGILHLIWPQALEIEKVTDLEGICTSLSHSPIAVHGNLLRIVTRSVDLAYIAPIPSLV